MEIKKIAYEDKVIELPKPIYVLDNNFPSNYFHFLVYQGIIEQWKKDIGIKKENNKGE